MAIINIDTDLGRNNRVVIANEKKASGVILSGGGGCGCGGK